MITALWLVSLLAGLVTIGDMLRRPASEWVAADRDRSYWVTMAALGGFMCLGLVAGAVYLMSVVPRLGGGAGPDPAFRKGPAAGATAPPVAAPPPPPRAVPPTPADPAPPAPLWATPADPADALPSTEPRRKLVIDLDDI